MAKLTYQINLLIMLTSNIYNQNNRTNYNSNKGKVKYTHINAEILKIKKASSKHEAQNAFDMIVYLLDHPTRDKFKTSTVNRIVSRAVKYAEKFGINIEPIKHYTTKTITV